MPKSYLFSFFLNYFCTAYIIQPIIEIKTESNIWEESGYFEGDIIQNFQRNGLLNVTYYWPNGLVPFEIDEQHFSEWFMIRL